MSMGAHNCCHPPEPPTEPPTYRCTFSCTGSRSDGQFGGATRGECTRSSIPIDETSTLTVIGEPDDTRTRAEVCQALLEDPAELEARWRQAHPEVPRLDACGNAVELTLSCGVPEDGTGGTDGTDGTGGTGGTDEPPRVGEPPEPVDLPEGWRCNELSSVDPECPARPFGVITRPGDAAVECTDMSRWFGSVCGDPAGGGDILYRARCETLGDGRIRVVWEPHSCDRCDETHRPASENGVCPEFVGASCC